MLPARRIAAWVETAWSGATLKIPTLSPAKAQQTARAKSPGLNNCKVASCPGRVGTKRLRNKLLSRLSEGTTVTGRRIVSLVCEFRCWMVRASNLLHAAQTVSLPLRGAEYSSSTRACRPGPMP